KGDYKLTKYFGYEKLNTKKQGKPMYELYNLKEDPNELNNLFDRKQTLVKELLQELEHELAKSNEPYD
ncbi:MAG: hypothetical protein OEZ02_15685, partial [Anaerolineae bacterium]|nr:hypothetical protein [Anaerolineae bacterium]